jgi:nucleoside-diphosphate-sugar epimerase
VARAIIELGQAPLGNIKSVNYLLAGTTPIASAGELAEMVRAKIPGAQIDFQPDLALQAVLDRLRVSFDDHRAREEWGWTPHYTQEQIIDDFLLEMQNQGS